MKYKCVCGADLRKQFEREPLSTSAKLQSTVQLQCLPPVGEPPPRVCSIRLIATAVCLVRFLCIRCKISDIFL